MSDVTVVTTCNYEGYRQYGHRFMTSFEIFWPRDVPLLFFCEGFDFEEVTVRGTQFDLIDSSSWLREFKARHKDNIFAHGQGLRPKRGFRWDAVKFAHKVAAVLAADERTTTRYLCWLDADTLTHAEVSPEVIASWLPGPEVWLSWLDRNPKLVNYPECGFLLFDREHFQHKSAFDFLRALYRTDEVLKLDETHDSFVWQYVVNTVGLPVRSLSGDGYEVLHVLANSPLSQWLDHLKGPGRKQRGRTDKIERVKIKDGNPYWNY